MAKISIAGLNYNGIITKDGAYYYRNGKKVLLNPSSDSDDIITGGNGADYIEAGDGNDVITGGNGKDTIYGGLGDDTICGDSSKSLDQTEENAKDIMYGGSGKDKIFGGNGADVLYGDGKDTGTGSWITAPASDKTLADYNDIIDGGNGPDRIIGGLGGDKLTGGSGPDTFVYDRIDDSRATNTGGWDAGSDDDANGFLTGTSDYITDFTKGSDQLDFTTLNINNPALHFSGTTSATNGIWYVIDGGYTYIFADTSGGEDGGGRWRSRHRDQGEGGNCLRSE